MQSSITVRLEQELSNWLKQKAAAKNCKVSDVVREAILKFQEMETLPEGNAFSPALHVSSSKASLMSYRLLERLTYALIENAQEIVEDAAKNSRQDIEKWKVDL